MTEKEALKVLASIEAAFPTGRQAQDPRIMAANAAVWADMLQEYSYDTVMAAVRTFISSSGSAFPPTIAQIIQTIRELQSYRIKAAIDSNEAWTMVLKAMNNAPDRIGAAYDELPDSVKKALGADRSKGIDNLIRWGYRSDNKTLESVIGTRFRKRYEQQEAAREQWAKIPAQIRKQIAAGIEANEQKQIAADNDFAG